MPTYNEGDEKKYLPGVIAALVVIAAIIGTALYSILTLSPNEYDDIVTDDIEINIPEVNPDGAGPNSDPDVEPPTEPPPS